MLNGKQISCKTIIAKVYRDLQLKEEEAFTDFIEWMSEALDFIHVYPQYIHKSACICIKNYKGELPCDYIGLDAVEYNGFNMLYSSNLYGPKDRTPSGRYYTPYSYNQEKINNVLLVKGNMLGPDAEFWIEGSWFRTSFKEGTLNIRYTAYPSDEDGYPLVPDHQSFKEALYWYITYKYLYAKALNKEIDPRFYDDAYVKWQYYCNQAGAEAMMPDLQTLEALKRSFHRLKPDMFQFTKFYNDLNNV